MIEILSKHSYHLLIAVDSVAHYAIYTDEYKFSVHYFIGLDIVCTIVCVNKRIKTDDSTVEFQN